MRVTPIRLVAVDLDGCLLDDQREIRPGALDALASLTDDGIMWCVATGRAVGRTAALRKQLFPTAGWVQAHGAVGDHGPWHRRAPLASRELTDIAAMLSEDFPDAVMAVDSADVLYHDADYPMPTWRGERTMVEARRDIMAQMKPDMLRIHSAHIGKIAVDIEELGLPVHLWDTGAPDYVEITAAGATKLITVSMLATYLGVHDAEVAAIGDGHSDITLLKWVEFGVAPISGHMGAVGAADLVLDDTPDWFTSAIEHIREYGRPAA